MFMMIKTLYRICEDHKKLEDILQLKGNLPHN